MKRSIWFAPVFATIAGVGIGVGAALLVSHLLGTMTYQLGGTSEAFYQQCFDIRQRASLYWLALVPLGLLLLGYLKLDVSHSKLRVAVLVIMGCAASPIGYWLSISNALDDRYLETFHGGPADVPSRQKNIVTHQAAPEPDVSLIDQRIVDCDNKFGVRTFQSVLSASDGKNVLIDSHGLNHLLHLDWILGTATTREILNEVTGVKFASEEAVMRQDKACDAVLCSAADGAKLSTECCVLVPPGDNVNDKLRSVLKSTGMELKNDPTLPSASTGFNSHLVVEAKWLRPFEKNKTSDAPFYPGEKNESVTVRMMNQSFDKDAAYSSFDEAEVIRLPYRGSHLALYVILPSKKMALAEFAKYVTPEKLESWTNLESGWSGELSLPQFSFDTDVDLGAAVARLGLAPLFVPGSNILVPLERSGATSYISALTCKGKIRVDEDGTKIETVTAQLNALSSYNPEMKIFKMVVDHPFLIVLQDSASNEIVCLGAFNAPSE